VLLVYKIQTRNFVNVQLRITLQMKIKNVVNHLKKIFSFLYDFFVVIEPQKSSLLSPLDVEPTNNSYDLCAVCDDNRAACIKAGNETTCWCRSGYTKEGKKCGKKRSERILIFDFF
jgi:hypothetical protein